MTFSLLFLLITSLHTLLKSCKEKSAVKSFFTILTVPSSKSVAIVLNNYWFSFHVFHIVYKYFRTTQRTIFLHFYTLNVNNTVSNNQISAKKLVLSCSDSWFDIFMVTVIRLNIKVSAIKSFMTKYKADSKQSIKRFYNFSFDMAKHGIPNIWNP